ncbi:cell division protein FtsQ/DivIB [Gynurincola endophyticus]|uniref:cell division protein FtsQ/DivIB n=1 Tax=Gynurincola endophyticus TaxID=2479004 RepID=UPI000F8F5BBC|nr:FtsQ-type POTRA domain-containing protein [Gynurincola endophyticus]
MKKKLRTVITIITSLAVVAGITVLLVAAVNHRNEKLCAGFEIKFRGDDKEWFMDKKDIVELLEKSGGIKIKGKPIVEFDLFKIENKIQQNPWVKNVDLHFDNHQILQIYIQEEQPVVRVFEADGKSYYFAENRKVLPLSNRVTAKVPVITGFPTELKSNQKKYKTLVDQIIEVSKYIQADPFWKAQIAQMYLQNDTKLYLVPTVGKQTIQFGTITDIPKKFRKLDLFYEQVLANVGVEKYKTIDVQFEKQIVATK